MSEDIATVYAVDSVQLSLLKSNPPSLVISAAGRVTSSGWSNGRLSRYVYLVPPADGVQEFDFVATPPPAGSVVLPALAPISADFSIGPFDQFNFWGPGQELLGVRVYAASNSKTTLFAGQTGMPPVQHVDPKVPVTDKLSFERDIKGLFRAVPDVIAMKNRFNLHVHADVAAHADSILARLKETDPFVRMPCDGPWPATDIARFEQWMQDGKLP